jgi:hypothetical protein
MDLGSCDTMFNLVEKIKLYLIELGSDQVAYVVVDREDSKKFRVGSWDVDRYRLLAGSGREGTYILFLDLLMSASSQSENRCFRFSVVTKKPPGC